MLQGRAEKVAAVGSITRSADSPRQEKTSAGGLIPLGLFRRYIAGKILVPHLLLILLLAVLATYITINLIAGSLEEKFREELAGAGRSANEAMVLTEAGQLAALRQMTFTVGVAEALGDADAEALQRLLAPIAANNNVPYVDAFLPDGTQLLALRAPELGPGAARRIDPTAREWGPVRAVLQGQVDALGDKYAEMVFPPWGGIFVTAGPVKRADELRGVISVALPVEEVTTRLSREAGAKGVTLYRKDGTLVSSSVRAAPESLAQALRPDEDTLATLLRGDQVIVRRAEIDGRPYVETLGLLAVRREPSLVLGVGNLVSIIEDRGAEMRNTMIAVFSMVVVLVFALGLLLARGISQPLRALVDATARIRRNDLDFELAAETEDETGILTTAFNEMTGGLRERERSRVAIEKYMSPKVYRLIQSGELKLGGQSREITVLKTDIRGFTSLAETMEAEALIDFLNRYFERMVLAVHKYEGEVDKYMGDSILVKFGATEWYPDHARKASLAMVEMIEACERFSSELQASGLAPIRMGIGGNTGPAVIGNVGSAERMEYTIISDAVNSAQRIEELCKEFNWDLLISEMTYEGAKDAIEVGNPWSVQLRGQTHQTLVYPVLGRKGEVPPDRRRAYNALLAAGRFNPGAGASVGRPNGSG